MSKKQHLLFALITVLITVPCFVFYCLSIENGGILNVDWKFALILIPIEFVLAFLTEIFIGSPIAMKIANKTIDFKNSTDFMKETVIICSTVLVMVPVMTFWATILYTGIFPAFVFKIGITLGSFLKYFVPNFLQTMVLNFPFALLSQLFFIQPIVRWIFKKIFAKKA